MRRLALVLTVVMSVLSAGLLTASPAAAWEPVGGAVFNKPPPWGQKQEPYAIVRHVEAAIRNVPAAEPGQPRPEILVTSYLLDRDASVNGLIAACQRGASVRVILDKGIETAISKKLIAALNGDNVMDHDGDGIVDGPRTGPCGQGEPVTEEPVGGATAQRSATSDPEPEGRGGPGLEPLTDRQARQSVSAALATDVSWGGDESYVTQCRGACRGTKGKMHTKFYAFSTTGTANNVVMVSSSNLNAGGALRGWNDLYTMKFKPETYAMYETVHDEMGRDRPVPQSFRQVREGPYTSRVFPLENGGKANDPTLADLNRVRCGSDLGRTRIHISMFYWQGVRGDYLADRILGLAREGCRVNIIMGAPSRAIAERLRAAARAGRIGLWDSRVFNRKRELVVRTHHKYTLVKGTYAGDRSAHLVMTGSQNWGHGSLAKSDDNTLNIELVSAYNQYLRNWNVVRKHSKRIGR